MGLRHPVCSEFTQKMRSETDCLEKDFSDRDSRMEIENRNSSIEILESKFAAFLLRISTLQRLPTTAVR